MRVPIVIDGMYFSSSSKPNVSSLLHTGWKINSHHNPTRARAPTMSTTDADEITRGSKRPRSILASALRSSSNVSTPMRAVEHDDAFVMAARKSMKINTDADDDTANEDEDGDVDDGDFASDFAKRSGCVSAETRRSVRPPATLALEYWTRSEETTEAKRRHIERLDDEGGYYGVEEHIERTVLKNADVAIEVNMFPYDCPRGVTHHTLWSRKTMTGAEIVEWTCGWLRKNKPRCVRWNFDLNENHSVDVPHYHVFTYEPPIEEDGESPEAGEI